MPPRSKLLSFPVEVTSVASRAATIRTPVTYGRVSGAMPGISSRRSRLSVGCFGREDLPLERRRRPRARGSPDGVPRSIFGARLRTRCPQYGHSVTYGLTSELQFLQTTKRSGSLTETRIPAHDPRL